MYCCWKETCVHQFGAMSANEKDVFVRGTWNLLVLDVLYAFKIYCELWLIGNSDGKTYNLMFDVIANNVLPLNNERTPASSLYGLRFMNYKLQIFREHKSISPEWKNSFAFFQTKEMPWNIVVIEEKCIQLIHEWRKSEMIFPKNIFISLFFTNKWVLLNSYSHHLHTIISCIGICFVFLPIFDSTNI